MMGDSKVRCISSARVKEINGGLPEFGGTFFGVPMMKVNSILGSILGSPYLRKLPIYWVGGLVHVLSGLQSYCLLLAVGKDVRC